MPYERLTNETAITYLSKITIFSDQVTTESVAEEIGDGNINFVFIVSKLKDDKKLVIKQAVPFLRCIGESYQLSRGRMNFEAASLRIFHGLAPANVPEVYYVDTEMSLVVMQYLESHQLMRKGLINQVKYPSFAEHISEFLATILFKTSSLFLQSHEKRRLVAQFIGNEELCDLTENFVFTLPYMQHETNRIKPYLSCEIELLRQDDGLKGEILKLKNKFMTQADALLHGDLHTGSIMLNERETFIIDSEFAFVGPMGFDMGVLIANLVMSWASHFERSKNEVYQLWLIEIIVDVYSLFERKFIQLWNANFRKDSALVKVGFFSSTSSGFQVYQRQYMQKLLKDVMGFAGLEMLRRIFGVVGVADIEDIPDSDSKLKVEKLVLHLARRFIVERESFETIKAISDVLENERIQYDKAQEVGKNIAANF